jgi:hypothetical protein
VCPLFLRWFVAKHSVVGAERLTAQPCVNASNAWQRSGKATNVFSSFRSCSTRGRSCRVFDVDCGPSASCQTQGTRSWFTQCDGHGASSVGPYEVVWRKRQSWVLSDGNSSASFRVFQLAHGLIMCETRERNEDARCVDDDFLGPFPSTRGSTVGGALRKTL